MKRILVIEDNGDPLEPALEALRNHGFNATLAPGCGEAPTDDGQWPQGPYGDIIHNAPIGIFRSTLDGRFISVNPALARILRYDSPEDLMEKVNRKSIAEVLYPDPGQRREVVADILSHEEWRVFEVQYRCKDASIVTCRDYIRLVPGKDGREPELEGFVENVTDRKNDEALLQENLSRLQTMVRNAPVILYGVDRNGIFTLSEGKGLAGMGLKPGEAVGRSLFDVYKDHPEALGHLSRALAGEAFTAPLHFGDHVFDAYHEPLFGADGTYAGTYGVVVDVTERAKAEEALRFTQFAIDKTIDQAFWMTKDARLFYVNEAACRTLGYSREELLQMSIPDIGPTFPPEVFAEHWRDLQINGSARFESWHRAKNGRVYPVEIRANYVVFDGKEYNCAFATDITERKGIEKALRESEEKYRRLIQKIHAAVVVHGADTRILMSNLRAQHLLGLTEEQMTGKSAIDPDWHFFRSDGTEMLPEEYPVNRVLATKQPVRNSVTGVHRSGMDEDVWVLVNADPVLDERGEVTEAIVTFIDITDRKRAEEERKANLWFFESMDRINRTIQGADNLEQMMIDVLDEILSIFECDRAWLVYPCDPEAVTWKASMERNRPEYPGAFELGLESPMDPDVARVYKTVLASDDPVGFGPGNEHPLPAAVSEQFNEPSQLALAIYPKVDKPYMFGVHQCSYPRVWSPEERSLLKQIGRRLADGLSTLLIHYELRESEEKYRVVADFTYDWETWLDTEGRFIYVSPSCERITGYSAGEFLNKRGLLEKIVQPDDSLAVEKHLKQVLKKDTEVKQIEFRIITRDGKERWIEHICQPVFGADGKWIGRRASNRDSTDRKLAEEKVRAALAEKELLLKEVHHRVKNNMQIISTLLDLQSEGIRDEAALAAFRESQDRIKAMALIHERLYESRDIAFVDFQRYIEALSAHLFDSYLVDPGRITLHVDAGGVTMGIDRAIPCGLIINELVTNALKHAFPDNRQGEIRVLFRAGDDGRITLSVSDNGVGLPPGLDFARAGTLGLQLVNMLSRQLRAETGMSREEGTLWSIIFSACDREIGA